MIMEANTLKVRVTDLAVFNKFKVSAPAWMEWVATRGTEMHPTEAAMFSAIAAIAENPKTEES